jgi:addiction module HigA family antidote
MKTMPLPNAFAETLRDTLDEWPATQKEISAATGILASHLSEMKAGRRRCTPEYDLRLSRFFSMEEGFWMRLQLHYEMQRVRLERGAEIDAKVKPAA